jgi:hypothetical protein
VWVEVERTWTKGGEKFKTGKALGIPSLVGSSTIGELRFPMQVLAALCQSQLSSVPAQLQSSTRSSAGAETFQESCCQMLAAVSPKSCAVLANSSLSFRSTRQLLLAVVISPCILLLVLMLFESVLTPAALQPFRHSSSKRSHKRTALQSSLFAHSLLSIFTFVRSAGSYPPIYPRV